MTQPPTLLLPYTSHPPLATKAASVRNFLQNKKTLAPPTSLALQVSCSHFFCALSSGRAIPQTNFSRLGSPSFPAKTPWRKPWSCHLSPWNTVITCQSPPFVAFSSSSCVCRSIANQTHWAGPYLNSAIPPAAPTSSETFLPLHHLLKLLPNFMPTSVQGLLSPFCISGTNFYELAAFGHLQSKGILPGSRSDAMDAPYDWPLEWDLRTPPGDACFVPLQQSHPDSWQLLVSLGGHFLKRLIAALLAPNGHFPSLLLSTLWGIQGGFTSLCVQGIFGSGKTYCASLLLVLVSTVLRLPTVLTAEPNLPLATAAETISDLLRDAPDETKSAYARVLAYSVPKLTPIDVLPIDRPKLFQSDSPLMCLILTHGSVLRDLCRDYPQIRTFLEACRLAINDESQQGGHAGFTILATCLLRECLQIFTGDREQTRAGTGGDQLRESLLKRLSHKSIGFLGVRSPASLQKWLPPLPLLLQMKLPFLKLAPRVMILSLCLRHSPCRFFRPPVIPQRFSPLKGLSPPPPPHSAPFASLPR